MQAQLPLHQFSGWETKKGLSHTEEIKRTCEDAMVRDVGHVC